MNLSNDTIAAISTPLGYGGIGIIRISGDKSREVLDRLFTKSDQSKALNLIPWKLTHGVIHSVSGEPLDDVLAVFMPAPHTFTGEDVVEFHCHGSPVLLQAILQEILQFARLAMRGEFSRRAYINGRMDLTGAEAISELIAAPTVEGARIALDKMHGALFDRLKTLSEILENLRARLSLAVDFPDDEIPDLPREDFSLEVRHLIDALEALLNAVKRTRIFTNGAKIALFGPVNAGKSSLMNALLGHERAIVTPYPGTTRDFLEETVNLDGLIVKIVDTAGFRPCMPSDGIEAEGYRLGWEQIESSDLALLVIDGVDGITDIVRNTAKSISPDKLIIVWNKSDISTPPSADQIELPCASYIAISAKFDDGIDELARILKHVLISGLSEMSTQDPTPNLRQAEELQKAFDTLTLLLEDVEGGMPYEICAVRLEDASRILSSVMGVDAPEEVLNRIFEKFCIGK